METRNYYYRGMIERGTGRPGYRWVGYRWVRGYSEAAENGQVLYPWMTKVECRREAKRDGVRAVFYEDETLR